MTTPAKMQTPASFVSEWRQGRMLWGWTNSEVIECVTARDQQHAAQPRVSRATRRDVFQILLRDICFEQLETIADRVAAAMGVEWPAENDPNRPKETTMEQESNRQRLAGEIAVMGEPLSMDEAKSAMRQQAHDARTMKPEPPDMSGLPDYELTGEYREPRQGEMFAWTEYGDPLPTTSCGERRGPEWIIRRRTPPATCKESLQVPPTVKDSLTVHASEEAEVDRVAQVIHGASRHLLPLSQQTPDILAVRRDQARAVLAEVRKPVELDALAKAIVACGDSYWSEWSEADKERARKKARYAAAFLRVPIAEPAKADGLVERLERSCVGVFGEQADLIREAIERLKKETKA